MTNTDLQAAYEALEEEFASVEHYLEQALGLNGAARQRLQSRLVEDKP